MRQIIIGSAHENLLLITFALPFASCVIFHTFLSSADFFQNHLFQKNISWNTIRGSNSLDSEQVGHFVEPGLGLSCLQS